MGATAFENAVLYCILSHFVALVRSWLAAVPALLLKIKDQVGFVW
jgi:hypothetical protein